MSRLTTDVQEFKSSFKLVISQVSGPGPPPPKYTVIHADSAGQLCLPQPQHWAQSQGLLPSGEGVGGNMTSTEGGAKAKSKVRTGCLFVF